MTQVSIIQIRVSRENLRLNRAELVLSVCHRLLEGSIVCLVKPRPGAGDGLYEGTKHIDEVRKLARTLSGTPALSMQKPPG